MAKKKSKNTRSHARKKTVEEGLFDKHPNLIWLLPILGIAFVISLLLQNSSM